MSFNRWDICEAWWLFANMYHSGQGSRLYSLFARLERLGFRPFPSLSEDTIDGNAQEIYLSLVARKGELT